MLTDSLEEDQMVPHEEEYLVHINLFSTSPEEKGMIFSKIENKITTPEIVIEKYDLVMKEIKMNSLHRNYNKKIYDTILLQLTRDWKIRHASRLWYGFINSF